MSIITLTRTDQGLTEYETRSPRRVPAEALLPPRGRRELSPGGRPGVEHVVTSTPPPAGPAHRMADRFDRYLWGGMWWHAYR